MADMFKTDNVQALLDKKYILFFGDSNIRNLYKDLVTLYQKNQLISEASLSKKLEPSFEGDCLLHNSGLTKGRNYREHRIFNRSETCLEFFFITKCFSNEIQNTLKEIFNKTRRVPDVVVISSTLWDVTRWGCHSVSLFKDNLKKLVQLLRQCLPKETVVIWLTAPPLARVRGGFIIKEVEFMRLTIRFEAQEANAFAHSLLSSNGFDVLDIHFFLKMLIHRRNSDGVHWSAKAVRYILNLLLTHISIAWTQSLPGNFKSVLLDKLLDEVIRKEEKPSEDSTSANPRVKAKDRLGDSVISSSGLPEEDLRVRLESKAAASRTKRRRRWNSRPHDAYQHDVRHLLNMNRRDNYREHEDARRHQRNNVRYFPYQRPSRCPW